MQTAYVVGEIRAILDEPQPERATAEKENMADSTEVRVYVAHVYDEGAPDEKLVLKERVQAGESPKAALLRALNKTKGTPMFRATAERGEANG